MVSAIVSDGFTPLAFWQPDTRELRNVEFENAKKKPEEHRLAKLANPVLHSSSSSSAWLNVG